MPFLCITVLISHVVEANEGVLCHPGVIEEGSCLMKSHHGTSSMSPPLSRPHRKSRSRNPKPSNSTTARTLRKTEQTVSSTKSLDFLNLPDKIEYKEPAWKAALRALEVNDSEPPVKPVRGQATESAPENKENLGCVEVVENNKSTPASEGGQSSDEIENVVLRQPSASRLRRMDRKLGRKPGPPTASKPHTRSLSLPESSNVRLMRQQALDNNHNSATYEDIDDDDEDDYDPVRSVSLVFS